MTEIVNKIKIYCHITLHKNGMSQLYTVLINKDIQLWSKETLIFAYLCAFCDIFIGTFVNILTFT